MGADEFRDYILGFIFYKYLSEKMYRVVTDRERWFNIVMGNEVAMDTASTDKLAIRFPVPQSLIDELAFNLGVSKVL